MPVHREANMRKWSVGLALALMVACGSRTGLLGDYEDEEDPDNPDVRVDVTQPEGGLDVFDVIPDRTRDVTPDRRDVGLDVRETGPDVRDVGPDRRDVGPDRRDVGLDVRETGPDVREVGPDVPDVVPPLDVVPPPDVDRTDCPNPDATYIYLIGNDAQLLSYYPPDNTVRSIGRINCPATPGATPFSMAVDRKGTAYVLYNDESLFRVSTKNGSCKATTYVPRQSGYGLFGMGFASDDVGPAEKLYVAGNSRNGGTTALGYIDTNQLVLHHIGAFNPTIDNAELTGTGSGALFAFYAQTETSSSISQVEKETGVVVGQTILQNVEIGNGWAFAFWGGEFFMFTAPRARTGSVVWRYNPRDATVVEAVTLTNTIVGAGVSTCAPVE